MADGTLNLNPGAGGDALDVEEISEAGQPLKKRERVVVGGDQPDDLAHTRNARPDSADYGLPVRDVELPGLIEDLKAEIDGLEESLGTTADDDTATTVIGRLQKLVDLLDGVETTLTGIEADTTTIANEDFATETTLATVATEAKLEAVRLLLVTLRDNQFRRNDALAAGTNQVGSTVPDRPSQGSGRTHVTATLDLATADDTVHTVTAGKTLYVTSMEVSFRNLSNVAASALRIRDGDGGTLKGAWELSSGVTGATTPHFELGLSFAEPKQFTDAVFADVSGGTPSYSITVVGYEA